MPKVGRVVLVSLLLALVTLVLYWPVTRFAFVNYDDPDYVVNNEIVRQGITKSGIAWAFDSRHVSNWHPITWLSHMLDCAWHGTKSGGHHLTNLLLHTTDAVLLFAVLLQFTGKTWPAAVVAALFAWHPLHVESVAWVAERKDVLSGFFWLLTLGAYGRFAMTADPASTRPIARKAAAKVPPVNRMAWYWSAVALFALGLMSKPMVVTLPFVLLLLDYWPLKRFAGLKAADISSKPSGSGGPTSQSIGRLLLEKGPFFLLTAMSCVATLWAQKSQAIVGLDVLPLSVRIGNAVVSYALYLWTTIWPAKLAVVYPYAGEWPLATVAAAASCLLAVSAVVVWQARRRPYFTVGWLWFLGTLLPVIGLVQVGIQSRADRYTYLPLIGVFMMVAWGGAEALTKRPQARQWVISVAALMLLALLVSTRMQMQHWRNGVELFTRAAEINPDCYLVECNLAEALAQQGDFKEAVAHYRKAIAIRPNRLEIARGFKIAAQSNLGKLFAARGKWAEAENQFRAAVVEDPGSWEARVNLGNVLLGVGRAGEAVAVFRDGVKARPESAELWRRLGVALFTQGKGAEALKAYREAARLNPDGPAELNALAWFLATSPQAELRNGAEAVRLAQRACALSGGREALFLGTLDAALAETGRFAEALAAAQSAQRLAREQGNSELAIAAQERMALYQSGKPYRQR